MRTAFVSMVAVLALAVAAALAATPATPATSPVITAPDAGGPDAPWRNKALRPELRARDLLARLTLEEKISLVHADGTFSTAELARFNIPKRWMSDGPNGVREEINPQGWNSANRTDDFATALPACVGLAASFDPTLARAHGDVIGEEAAVRNKHIMLCPGLNIMRTPLNGRNSEYFGEDPYLAGRMAVNYIQGIQAHNIAACAKHYALNNQEFQRSNVSVELDDRALHEIYLPAFKAAVTEGGVLSIMTGYNRVRGDYCAESDLLLNQILKRDWRFQGVVMSDWGGIHLTVKAAINGSDLEMGTNVNAGRGGPDPHDKDFFAQPLLQAVQAGQVPMTRLDDMALRNLRVMAATGMFDLPTRPENPGETGLMAQPHIETARRIAENSIVLLKNNDNLLPIDTALVKTIAVIGGNADTRFASFGDSARIKTRYEVTPLEGIRRRIANDMVVTYSPGYAPARGGRGRGGTPATAPTTQPNPMIADAVRAALNADLTVIVAGLHRAQDQEGSDRPSYELPAGQVELIQAVLAVTKRTVVVLNGGSPSSLQPWIKDCPAVMMYWYGGTEGGVALARTLFGDVNPSAKLPCTWPVKLADSPAHSANDPASYPGVNRPITPPATAPGRGPANWQQNYAEGIYVGYRWFDEKKIEPEFPFGFGLSYTKFELSALRVTPISPDVEFAAADRLRQPILTLQATVANTGAREGAQVVQIYVQDMASSLPRPPRELKAFTKINLAPGQRSAITLPLDASAFAFYDPAQKAWVAEAGEYTIHVGDSSRNLPLKATFNLPRTITVQEGL